jgi:hypothetical protein
MLMGGHYPSKISEFNVIQHAAYIEVGMVVVFLKVRFIRDM